MPADRDAVGCRRGGHVTLEANPVDRAVGTFAVPVFGLVERSGDLREPELQAVDLVPQRNQLERQVCSFGRRLKGHLLHANIVRNFVRRSKRNSCKFHSSLGRISIALSEHQPRHCSGTIHRRCQLPSWLGRRSRLTGTTGGTGRHGSRCPPPLQLPRRPLR